jgi:hypothetical protein
MADIIDNTTAGPIPDNADPRPVDVITDQKIKQDNISVGGSQQPPTITPPMPANVGAPPMPYAEVSMPSVSSFAQEAARQAAQDAVKDTIKNMTINGQSPTISGSSISFDVPVIPPASSAFATQNPPVAQAQAPATPPPPTTAQAPTTPPQTTTPPAKPSEPPSNTETSGAKTPDSAEPEEDSSAAAYKRGYERQQAKKAAQAQEEVNPLSRERGGQEMRGEYRERMAEMDALSKDKDVEKAISAGDASYFRSGFVPVLLKRNDGKRKILLQVDNANSSVVYGATRGERTTPIPGEGGYYTSDTENGCPFDVIMEAKAPPSNEGCSPSTESIFAAVKHTDCQDCVGDNNYSRYSSLFAKDEEVGLYAFHGEDADYNFKLLAKNDESTLTFYDGSSEKYLDMGVSADEAFMWGYINNQEINFRARVTEELGVFELWNDNGAYSKLYLDGTEAGFEAKNAEGNEVTIYPAEAWLKNNSEGSWTQVYSGGIYMNDGTNFINIQNPSGKDIYFQQVTVCVGGASRTAYVLMSDPE